MRPNLNVNLNVDLSARADIGFIVPGYVFDTKVFGGQFAVAMLIGYGKQTTTLDGTLSASLGPLSATRQGSITESATGLADLIPLASLRWNSGVHNLMIYGTIFGLAPMNRRGSPILASASIPGTAALVTPTSIRPRA